MFLRLRSSLALVAVLSLLACRGPVEVPAFTPAGAVSVEPYKLNRCSGRQARACNRDADCPSGHCQSILPSTAGAFGRDGGHSIVAGERVLWLFGDSFTPAGLLSMTAGWSDRHDPLSLKDVVDTRGTASQFVPFTDEELAFNRDHKKPPPCCRERKDCPASNPYCQCESGTDCNSRVALWPGDGLSDGERVIFFYEKYVIGVANYDFRHAGTGLATVTFGQPNAQRFSTKNEITYLFQADEPAFARGTRGHGAAATHLYLYAPSHRQACAVDVLSARVAITQLGDRAAYEFWDGKGWNHDIRKASPILAQVPGGLGSVAWSEDQQRYVSAWSDVCTGGKLMLRVADQPQGPWSAPLTVDLATVGASAESYYGWRHPEYDSGNSMLVSFYQPGAMLHGQIHLAKITLGNEAAPQDKK